MHCGPHTELLTCIISPIYDTFYYRSFLCCIFFLFLLRQTFWIYAWMSRWMTQKEQRVCFPDILTFSASPSVIHSLSFCSLVYFCPVSLILFSFFPPRLVHVSSHLWANAELQYSSVRDGNHPLLPDNQKPPGCSHPWQRDEPACSQCVEVASRGSSDYGW